MKADNRASAARPDVELLQTPGSAAFLAVLAAATGITTAAEQVFRETQAEIIPREFDLLVALEVYGPQRPSELLHRTWMTRNTQTLWSVINRMESRGLLTRSPHDEDGRGVVVEITNDGRGMLDGFFPLIDRRVIAPFRLAFTDEESATIASLLDRVG